MEFIKEAQQVSNEWIKIAKALNFDEVYYGYYDKGIEKIVTSKINDMLTEVEPRVYSKQEALQNELNMETNNLVYLLNKAWEVYLSDPRVYYNWEKEKIAQLL